uniref:Alpha-tocopherol transfer protein-like n=2 Tax=Culex pipiens TaxID=7175 RepID=A0A8D8FQW3_CULPI
MNTEEKEHIETIKTWLTTQHHLPTISDTTVHRFLHCNYYDEEKTKITIENYYTMRTRFRDLFSNPDLLCDEFQNAMSFADFIPLPQTTPEGYKVVLFRLSDTDPTHFSQRNLLRFSHICMQQVLEEHGMAAGHVIINDMTGMSLGHMRRMELFMSKNHMTFIQEAAPIRLKGSHMVNVVPFVDTLMKLMKPMMKRELYELVHLHQHKESLFPFVPQECLPAEYGGNAGTFKELRDNFYAKLLSNRDHFIRYDQENLVDDSKRPEQRGWFSMFRR